MHDTKLSGVPIASCEQNMVLCIQCYGWLTIRRVFVCDQLEPRRSGNTFVLREEGYGMVINAVERAATVAHSNILIQHIQNPLELKGQVNVGEVVRQIHSRPIDGQMRVSCSDGKRDQIVTRITWPKEDYHNRQFCLPKKLAIPMLEDSGSLHQV